MPETYDPTRFRALRFIEATAAFARGEDSPRAYLERCLDTIEQREPVVQAFVSLNAEGARAAADAADERWRAGRPLSPIDGMPVGIKDLYMTRDMPTRMGSPLFENNFPRQDTASVQALRDAGAVILGKTVTTELGMSHPGPTTNPFDATRTPGGSSSGSAAAVGAGMVPVALGSQVVGSVIRPAGFCANHAIKPTLGALHRGERQGLSHSHLGVHAGSLADMWAVCHAIAQRAGGDPGHIGLVGPATPHAALKPGRLAVIEAEGWAETDAASRAAFEGLVERLRAAGVEIVDRTTSPLVEDLERAIADSLVMCRDICAFEMRWSLRNLIEQHGGGLSESMMSRYELAQQLTLEDYRGLLHRREVARMALRAAAPAGEAMLCLSSTGPAPLMDNDDRDHGVLHTTGLPAFNAWTSVLGAPAITLPLLAVDGMPLGVQLVGQWHEDHRLTGFAAWVEQTVLAGGGA